jgi:nucleotide-binding universal stress UspA family protein
MKVLVAYDGSGCSEAAIDDLARAGLPETCEAIVISVAEVWLPPPNGDGSVTGIKLDPESERIIQRLYEKNERLVAEAGTLANHAKQRLGHMFPNWSVTAEATCCSPAWAILDRADETESDLIVVGSHGRSAVTRFFLGSISQKVMSEARCSVRVARGRIEVDPTPARIIIGFDGSKGSLAAVDAVASRFWPERSEVRLIAASDDVIPSAVGRFIPPATNVIREINGPEREWIELFAVSALAKLRAQRLSSSWHIHKGNPKEILVEEATRWNADTIFVGANAYGTRLERFLLGSTAAAVAARAHCSVELVRT